MGVTSKSDLGFFTTTIGSITKWAEKHSLFSYPLMTACCGAEYVSTISSHYDLNRFGIEIEKFTTQQSNLLFVIGTITHKMAPYVKEIYEQMFSPKWVIAFGACAASGGMYQNYSTVKGIDLIIPVDVYIAGCPPRPEAVLDAVLQLQEKIQHPKVK